jgi:hypothetical protein
MKRILTLLAAGLAGVVATLLALSFAASSFAQGPTGQATQPTAGMYGPGQQAGGGQMRGRGQGGGQMMGREQAGGGAQSLVGMAAAELGLTQAELVAQLGSDGTLVDALSAAGIEPLDFIERFVASRAERLEAAVAAGTLTRADADARLATARSMSAARIAQPFTQPGPGGQGPNQGAHGANQGAGFVDADGDGVCDQMPAGGQAQSRMGGHGPRR